MLTFYDNHIHRFYGESDSAAVFYDKARKAGSLGGNIFSLPPKSFDPAQYPDYHDRIEDLLTFCDGLAASHPFFWIDPTEAAACDQVEYAAKSGIQGFKILCSKYYPCDGIKTYEAIAKHHLPVLFHSGVLWDGQVSSDFNRPMQFEGLMHVEGFRFALAHVSWPWCDECIALYGKLLSAERGGDNHSRCGASMFIDTTPGTPFIYRKQVFEKIFLINYQLKERVIFGSDNSVNHYDAASVRMWIDWDFKIMQEIRAAADTLIPTDHELPSPEEMFRKAFQENYFKFLNGK